MRLSRSYGPGRYDASYEEGGHEYPIGYVRWTEQDNIAEFLRLLRARLAETFGSQPSRAAVRRVDLERSSTNKAFSG